MPEPNKEKQRVYARNWYQRNKVSEAAKKREKHAQNPELFNAMERERRKRDPEKARQYGALRRARDRKARPWVRLISGVKSRAKAKNLEFNLTAEWAEERWTGHCEVTGLAFDLGMSGSGPNTRSPSVDRINPNIGYTRKNCRIILHCVNALKQGGTDEEMLEVVFAITSRKH